MFSIRGKMILYALEIIAAVVLLLSIPPSQDTWIRVGLAGLSTLAIGLAVAMGWSITAGVNALGTSARRIGSGDYEVPVRVSGEDEIGRLGAELESMRLQLREKVRLLEEFAQSLEQNVAKRTAELKDANDRLALIHEVTNAVNSGLDFPTLFDAIISGTRRLVEFDQASVARIVDSNSALVFVSVGEENDLSEGRRIPLKGSRLEEVIRSHRPVVFDLPLGTTHEDTFLLRAIRREVVLPLTVGDEVIGTFNLGSRNSTAFSSEEIDVLTQIASELGVALLRAEAYERERAARRRLKELSDLKSEFVSRVSHELRTPLTSIIGGVDNLLDGIAGPVEEKATEYLARIRKNGKRLLDLINDLLDLSRIEAGEEELRHVRFSLNALLQETIETLRPIAAERSVEIIVEDRAPVALQADRDKISRVLLNLVHNALKFTKPGGQITLTVLEEKTLAGFSVRDTGVGIPADEMEKIFDRFHQVRAGQRRGTGTGLGLSISQELVTMHGGTIAVESVAEQGSTFTVQLPKKGPEDRSA